MKCCEYGPLLLPNASFSTSCGGVLFDCLTSFQVVRPELLKVDYKRPGAVFTTLHLKYKPSNLEC